jgi:hypothetical protein
MCTSHPWYLSWRELSAAAFRFDFDAKATSFAADAINTVMYLQSKHNIF